jgi:hypothetical protein
MHALCKLEGGQYQLHPAIVPSPICSWHLLLHRQVTFQPISNTCTPDAELRPPALASWCQILLLTVTDSGKHHVGQAAMPSIPPQKQQAAVLQLLGVLPPVKPAGLVCFCQLWCIIKLNLLQQCDKNKCSMVSASNSSLTPQDTLTA